MKLSVTREHIAIGKPGSGDHCPFAWAYYHLAKVTCPILCLEDIEVDGRYITNAVTQRIFRLPPEGHVWIQAFDGGSQMDPIEVEIVDVSQQPCD